MTTRERPYRGMSAADRRADRRRRLLAAALDLVGTDGYAAATIPEICSRAGVTARHLYEEFGGREELLQALYAQVVEEHMTVVAETLQSESDDFRAAVYATADAAVRGWLDDPRRARLAFVEVVGLSDAVEAQRMETMDAYARALAADVDRFAERGMVERRDRTIEARALVGVFTHLISDWLHREDKVPVGDLVAEIARIELAVLTSATTRASAHRR